MPLGMCCLNRTYHYFLKGHQSGYKVFQLFLIRGDGLSKCSQLPNISSLNAQVVPVS